MAKRGPKPRAGTRAEATIKARVTLDELRAARAIAKRLGCKSVADLLRIDLYVGAADARMDPMPEILGQDLIDRIVEIELERRRRRNGGPRNSAAVVSSGS